MARSNSPFKYASLKNSPKFRFKIQIFCKINLLKKRIRQMSLGRNPGLVVMVGSNPGTVYWMDIYSHIKDRK